MPAVALFSLKDPSLLACQEGRNDQNTKISIALKMSQRHDDARNPRSRRAGRDTTALSGSLSKIQCAGGLKSYVFHEDCDLLSIDEVEYFSSKKVHCSSCIHRKNNSSEEVTYYHQMLGAVHVHPEPKQVIPFAPEPIVKQDGDNKNDCGRNAAKRLFSKIREEHPHLKLIVVEDARASKAPHIRLLKQLHMHFGLGVKPADHEHLFDEVIKAYEIRSHDQHSVGRPGPSRCHPRDRLHWQSAAEEKQLRCASELSAIQRIWP